VRKDHALNTSNSEATALLEAQDEFEASPSIEEFINGRVLDAPEEPTRFRKTTMSAPRPRRAKVHVGQEEPAIDPDLQSIWTALPKNVEFLCSFYDDSVTKNYYRGEFKESRQQLIKRLLDPELSLEETSRLLGVCPATVRRYTNRGWLSHHRTGGGQRRFRLSNVVKFVDEHGRFPEE
jgi:excisionase family DNA binding protein